MKRLAAFLVCIAAAVFCGISASASEYTFALTPENVSEYEAVEYLPEQQIYHFTGAGSISSEIPAYDGLYVRVIAGGYRSESNGVTDNGVNCVCRVDVDCIYEDGQEYSLSGTALVPADGTFWCNDIGTDTMFAGLPDGVEKIRLTVTGMNETAYIKTLRIVSDNTQARDKSDYIWHQTKVGNINAQTSRADRFILIGFVCAVAVIMMISAKIRDKYRKGR